MKCNMKKFGATFTTIVLTATLAVSTLPANASVETSASAFSSMSATNSVVTSQKAQIAEFETRLNNLRASHGLNPVKFNENASVEAYNWSKKMGDSRNLRHTNESEVDQNSKNYYNRRNEIIADSKEGTVSSMFAQWEASDSHRPNMLDPNATSFGVGFYLAPDGKTYATGLLHSAKSGGLMPSTYSDVNAYFSGSSALPDVSSRYTLVNPAVPTINKTNSTYTVPSTQGIRYWNTYTESFISAGTYTVLGNRLALTPVPQNGYKISNPDLARSGWSWTFHQDSGGSAYNPNPPYVFSGKIILPYDEYVDWYVNGKLEEYAYSPSATEVSKVTAKIKNEYKNEFYLDKYENGWEISVGLSPVQSKPVITDAINKTYTIPNVANVVYMVNGLEKSAGTYSVNEGDTIDVTVKAKQGYYIAYGGTFNYSYKFPFVSNIQVTAKNPVFDNNNFTYTIPSVDGITYKVDGVAKNAGTYKAEYSTSYNITANANEGYIVNGTSSWTNKFPAKPLVSVTATPPTFNSSNMTYTIPSKAGVTYKVNGTTVQAGTYKAEYSAFYSITVSANTGYVLSGTSSWTNSFPAKPPTSITATAPTFNNQNMSYTIPSQKGVSYSADGVAKNAGTYYSGEGKRVNIKANATSGYALSGTSAWSNTFPVLDKKVYPATPVVNYPSGTYTIPSTTGVTYSVNGKTVSAGTYSSGYSIVNITSKANSGYAIAGNSAWSFDLRKITVDTTAPNFDTNRTQVIIPSTKGVSYYIDGVKKNAGVYNYSRSSVVTVEAKPSANNYALRGTTKWTKDFRYMVTPTRPAVAGKQVTIPSKSGVVYYINGVKKNAGKHTVSNGTVKVTTKSTSSSYKLSGTQSWTWTFAYNPTRPTTNNSRNQVTIPKMSGVNYYINGKYKGAGTHSATGTFTVTTKASNSNVVLGGTTKWNLDNRDAVTPRKPSNSASKNTITIPRVTGVNYYINGKYKGAGTHKYSGYEKVTTKASSGHYKLTGTQSWNIDNRNAVRPKKPSNSTSKNTITIPKVTGVNYYINGKYKGAGKYKYSGYEKITTKVSSGSYKLSGTQSWNIDNRNSVKPATPSFSTSKNTVKIPKSTGVKYYVNGHYKKAGTYKYKNGTNLKVTTKASSGYYKLSGTQSWTKRI